MKITLIAYGIAKEIIGSREISYEISEPASVKTLLEKLEKDYPRLHGLSSLRVAINSEYALGNQAILAMDEVVLIPPVSGG
ncbi:MAG: MoaD/ThiS family protein [Bacteroidia bacterium]|nr:MoaD/ThiS family protein [Bacteroidia bacterium]